MNVGRIIVLTRNVNAHRVPVKPIVLHVVDVLFNELMFLFLNLFFLRKKIT